MDKGLIFGIVIGVAGTLAVLEWRKRQGLTDITQEQAPSTPPE